MDASVESMHFVDEVYDALSPRLVYLVQPIGDEMCIRDRWQGFLYKKAAEL